MIPLSKIAISQEEAEFITKILLSGNIVQGKRVKEFERKIANFCGSKYAIAVSNGTAALHTALMAIGVKPGDEVITSPFTFVATANAILMCGAHPVFVDIDPETYNINPLQIEKAITAKTKAIMPVNLYGLPADYDKINKIAKKHNIYVVEDAAQSIGAIYKNKKSGNLADISCFSLYATKNLASGEGGIITTNNKNFYNKAVLFRHHGQDEKKRYHYYGLGYNYRMTDVFAELALQQLKKLDFLTKKRQQNAETYLHLLNKIQGIKLPVCPSELVHVYHQFTIRINKNRNKVKKALEKKGIQTNIYYPTPINHFPHLGAKKNSKFPEAEKASKEVLSIPVHPYLTDREISYIIREIEHVLL